jgi:hypothetical protein
MPAIVYCHCDNQMTSHSNPSHIYQICYTSMLQVQCRTTFLMLKLHGQPRQSLRQSSSAGECLRL